MSTARSSIGRATSASVAQRQAASYTGVHRSLLAGFCTMVGARGEEGVYVGTRGVHFHIFPGSPLVRRRPRWLMAANIVETSRVFARRVAEIEPQWIEAAAAHLLKREYLEPDWDEEREEVVARERVSFLGLILSANRMVNYGPIAPEESRRIFAREALVYQRLQRRPDWLLENDAAVRAAHQDGGTPAHTRSSANAEAFVEFYDRVLPRQVSSGATLGKLQQALVAGSSARRSGLDPSGFLRVCLQPKRSRNFRRARQVDALVHARRISLRSRGIAGRCEPEGAAAGVAGADARGGGCRGSGPRRAAHRGAAAIAAKGGAAQLDSNRAQPRRSFLAEARSRQPSCGAACRPGSRSGAAFPTLCSDSILRRCPRI